MNFNEISDNLFLQKIFNIVPNEKLQEHIDKLSFKPNSRGRVVYYACTSYFLILYELSDNQDFFCFFTVIFGDLLEVEINSQPFPTHSSNIMKPPVQRLML